MIDLVGLICQDCNEAFCEVIEEAPVARRPIEQRDDFSALDSSEPSDGVEEEQKEHERRGSNNTAAFNVSFGSAGNERAENT